MGESQSYIERLDQAILAKSEAMDRTELKQLKDDYKLFQTAYQAVYNVLLRKGLIHEDPYKYELKISEVGLPPETPFPESEKLDQMCMRLSQFESYLDFLNNYYQFSVDFLTMGRIKRLVALGKYFNFVHFTETSPHINTRYFAELVSIVRKGSDPLSTGILNESMLQLEKSIKRIFQTLKELSDLHRERYKLELRRMVTQAMNLERDYVVTHRDDAVKKIKNRIAELGNALPFSEELVEETLLEDYSSDSVSLRDAVLARLAVKNQGQKKQGTARNYKAIVLEGARLVIGAGFAMSDAVHKLEENQASLESLDKSFFTKLKRAVRDMLGHKAEHVVHEVDYLDPVSSERRNETLDFTAFITDGAKRAQSLNAMAAKNSSAYARLEEASEDQCYSFLQKSIDELQNFFRRASAFNEYFQDALSSTEMKNKIKNASPELGVIKLAMVKANQKRHEYLSLQEELEQMKRLGIRES
ncbi:MAG TPA: hypothetical protein PLC54_03680 [Spirochaetales bacterium]|nr:hypothetical protein [Spirochaetales bacterium]